MFSRLSLASATGLLLLLAACDSGSHSSAGFRLASDGDVHRGKQAFLDLNCNHCHEVAGTDLPKPSIQPPVPVVLGGIIPRQKTDGYLAASIINPGHAIGAPRGPLILVGNRSRMPDPSDTLTIRQLTDLVAFLQSTYTVKQPESYRYGY